MLESNLWNRYNYTSDIRYIYNNIIYELDLQKANISVLYSKGLITKDTYEYLYNTKRLIRQIYIGNLQRENRDISLALKEGISHAKELLFKSNNIQDHEVLAIKNDAVYIIGRLPQVLEFDLLKFIPKNVYTAFYSIREHNLELYYYYNNISKGEHLHVKGISDENLLLHENYMLKFLKDLFYTIQTQDILTAINSLKEFYNMYTSRSLDINFYREFNSNSVYRYITKLNCGFINYNASINDINYLNISNNLNLLINLQKILMEIYFSTYK